MIAEKRKEEIRKEARAILQKVGKTLVALPVQESSRKGTSEYRKEGEGKKCDSDFREALLANAPKKDADCVIAERGKW